MQPLDHQAELGAIASVLGVRPSPDWTKRLAAFEPWLAGYLEYQIKLDEPALSVVTLGKEPQFLEQIAGQMQAAGASDTVLAAFVDLQGRVGQATWGLKLSLADPADVQVYVKKPIPLAAVTGWLAARNVPPTGTALLAQAGADLDKSHTHFVGLDATREPDLPLQIYFTQYTEGLAQVRARVLQVAGRLGLSDDTCAEMGEYVERLAGRRRTLWLSLTLVGRQFLPTLKLDFSSPSLVEVFDLFSSSERAKLQLLAQTIRAGAPDYVGLRFADGRPPRPGLYVTRRR